MTGMCSILTFFHCCYHLEAEPKEVNKPPLIGDAYIHVAELILHSTSCPAYHAPFLLTNPSPSVTSRVVFISSFGLQQDAPAWYSKCTCHRYIYMYLDSATSEHQSHIHAILPVN